MTHDPVSRKPNRGRGAVGCAAHHERHDEWREEKKPGLLDRCSKAGCESGDDRKREPLRLDIANDTPDDHQRAEQDPPRGEAGEVVWKGPAERCPRCERRRDRFQVSTQDQIDKRQRRKRGSEDRPPQVDQVDTRDPEHSRVEIRQGAGVGLFVVNVR